MKIERKKSVVRKIDDTLSIVSLFDGKDFSFDFVIGVLDGVHPKLVNKISDRAYYILKGFGEITVEGNAYKVKKGDLILIKANEIHGLNGDMEYIIVTSPPFDPNNERLV